MQQDPGTSALVQDMLIPWCCHKRLIFTLRYRHSLVKTLTRAAMVFIALSVFLPTPHRPPRTRRAATVSK